MFGTIDVNVIEKGREIHKQIGNVPVGAYWHDGAAGKETTPTLILHDVVDVPE